MQEDLLTDPDLLNLKTRKQLLPLWIKIFAWFFLLTGVLSVIVFILGIFGGSLLLSIYGIESQEAFSANWLLATFVFLLKGIVAFGLLTEKSWAIKLAIADAIVGLIICLATMFVPVFSGVGMGSFRIEIIILILYCLRMFKIKDIWTGSPSS